MNKLYHFAREGQQYGPFEIKALEEKGIRPETLVWTPGLENWVRAAELPELQRILTDPTPPPLAGMESEAESPMTDAALESLLSDVFGRESRKPARHTGLFLIGLFFLVLQWTVGFYEPVVFVASGLVGLLAGGYLVWNHMNPSRIKGFFLLAFSLGATAVLLLAFRTWFNWLEGAAGFGGVMRFLRQLTPWL